MISLPLTFSNFSATAPSHSVEDSEAKQRFRAQVELLVEKAQSGDKNSFEALYELTFNKIWGYTRKRVPETECEDIVGDIFLKVVQNLSKYEPTKVGFMAWVYRIAQNTIIDFYRKKKELLGEDLVSEDQSFFAEIPDKNLLPSEILQQNFDKEDIQRALEALKPDHKQFIELKFLEEFTNEEISHILKKSRTNVRVLQHRALGALQLAFEDLTPDYAYQTSS